MYDGGYTFDLLTSVVSTEGEFSVYRGSFSEGMKRPFLWPLPYEYVSHHVTTLYTSAVYRTVPLPLTLKRTYYCTVVCIELLCCKIHSTKLVTAIIDAVRGVLHKVDITRLPLHASPLE